MPALKEIHYLMKNLNSISNGQAKLVKFEHPKSTIDVYVELSPTDGFYKGGTFLFVIQICPDFPKESNVEALICMTPIYHPNIDTNTISYGSSNVCINLLDEDQTHLGLTCLVAALLYLLYNPQLDDPLAGDFAGLTMEQFQTNVKAFMNGEIIKDVTSQKHQQENMDEYTKQILALDEDGDPELEEEVRRQEETMDTDDDVTPLDNSEAMQLYSLIQHQNSIVQLDNNACALVDSVGQSDITPFSAPEHFKEEFNGYKLTKHGTTVIRDEVMPYTSNASPMSPFCFLTKRYTA